MIGALEPLTYTGTMLSTHDAHEAGFRAAASAHRRAHAAMPRRVRRGRNDPFFDLVSETERRRGGTPTPVLPTPG